jgi:pectin methylesterase-like acyl-CoA thioesterase
MALKNLGRSFSFSRRKPAHTRRRLNDLRPCAAEVLESRTLLSATLLVDHGNSADYQSIQAAVNAASAGATIKVAPGLYNENVTVGKPLTIL